MPSILEELLAARKATRKLIPNEKDDFMLFSRESTNVNTAIIAKIPTVTPRRDNMVRVRLVFNADIAKRKLSHESLKKSMPL